MFLGITLHLKGAGFFLNPFTDQPQRREPARRTAKAGGGFKERKARAITHKLHNKTSIMRYS